MIGQPTDTGWPALLEKIARERGFRCEAYKESCLRRRIAVRMRARGVHTFDAYGRMLDGDRDEYDRLLDTLTINVTKFFRNRETWDVLTPYLEQALDGQSPRALRMWSAGCASGEEPYTLAILLLELARRRGVVRPSPGCVDATDFDRRSLARAETGTYGPAAFDEMPPALVARYFGREEPRQILPEVRRLVRFRQHDLLREAPPDPPYDLVMCRNVVIYFDRPTQERLFSAFADALAPGGLLVLGKVETLVGPVRERVVLEDPRERIYRRR